MRLIKFPNDLIFYCLSLAITAFTVLILIGPNINKYISENVKAEGLFQPNGFVKFTLTLPVKSLKGLSFGWIELDLKNKLEGSTPKSFQVGKEYGNSIEFQGYTTVNFNEENPEYEVFFNLPDVDSLYSNIAEFEFHFNVQYPQKTTAGKFGFVNQLYTEDYTIKLPLNEELVNKSTPQIFRILFKTKEIFLNYGGLIPIFLFAIFAIGPLALLELRWKD